MIDREVAVLREREAEGERRAEEMRQKGEQECKCNHYSGIDKSSRQPWYGREYNELGSYTMYFVNLNSEKVTCVYIKMYHSLLSSVGF